MVRLTNNVHNVQCMTRSKEPHFMEQIMPLRLSLCPLSHLFSNSSHYHKSNLEMIYPRIFTGVSLLLAGRILQMFYSLPQVSPLESGRRPKVSNKVLFVVDAVIQVSVKRLSLEQWVMAIKQSFPLKKVIGKIAEMENNLARDKSEFLWYSA